jgi:hypothetical protein
VLLHQPDDREPQPDDSPFSIRLSEDGRAGTTKAATAAEEVPRNHRVKGEDARCDLRQDARRVELRRDGLQDQRKDVPLGALSGSLDLETRPRLGPFVRRG